VFDWCLSGILKIKVSIVASRPLQRFLESVKWVEGSNQRLTAVYALTKNTANKIHSIHKYCKEGVVAMGRAGKCEVQ
jgi:hypothetical protein